MLDRTNHFLIKLLICTLLGGASISQAADNRWYRVELMVFNHSGGQFAEKWEATPVLSYPEAVRFLRQPGQEQAVLDAQPTGTATDDTAPAVASDGLTAPQDNAAPSSAPLLPEPFVLLGSSEQEFRGKAAYMQRSGRYRILFHETWLQPVTSRSEALPIVLDQSGDTGQWPELQGSIQLYLSRYLHLETNLWLNTSGDYFPGSWRMPPPPLGPSSAAAEPQESAPDIRAEYSGEVAEPWDAIATETQETLEPIYPFRHAILLQQKRRMRSSEVHYLDHPVLGVVVKLTPLTAQDLESLARGETANATF